MATSPKIADGIRNVPTARGAPRQVLAGSLIAALLLGIFASRGLQAWADAKGDGIVAALLDNAVERWSAGLEKLGLTAPHDAARKAIRQIENAHWN